MLRDKLRIGVLASGSGSTFEAVYEASQDSGAPNFQPNLEIGLVISNSSTSGVWERAHRLGVPILHVSNLTQDKCTLPTTADG
jgi:folate-dependent phosphoribosylglycinamide formyltransferase PurN